MHKLTSIFWKIILTSYKLQSAWFHSVALCESIIHVAIKTTQAPLCFALAICKCKSDISKSESLLAYSPSSVCSHPTVSGNSTWKHQKLRMYWEEALQVFHHKCLKMKCINAADVPHLHLTEILFFPALSMEDLSSWDIRTYSTLKILVFSAIMQDCCFNNLRFPEHFYRLSDFGKKRLGSLLMILKGMHLRLKLKQFLLLKVI